MYGAGSVPFDIQEFLHRVEPETVSGFLKRHGNGKLVEWQEDAATIAREVVAALADNDWAAGALESCELIADSGGRDLLRTAGDHKPNLASGVENLDANDETCAVWLATEDPDIFDLVVSAAHARKGLGTRSWDAFSIVGRDPVHALIHDQRRIEQFRAAVRHVLGQRFKGVPLLRNVDVSHFEYSLERQASHSLRPLVQVNVYGETSPRNHETLVGGELTRMQLPGLYRAALVFDHGGRRWRS